MPRPERLRGTAFGIFDLAVGLATFTASAGAGLLWTLGGPAGSFVAGAALAAAAIVMLLFRAMPKQSWNLIFGRSSGRRRSR